MPPSAGKRNRFFRPEYDGKNNLMSQDAVTFSLPWLLLRLEPHPVKFRASGCHSRPIVARGVSSRLQRPRRWPRRAIGFSSQAISGKI